MKVRNVYEAMANVLSMFQHPTDKLYRTLNARGTYTWELREMPFITEYACPDECVMMQPTRNANPFFHLFEALHMLAGRNDLRFIAELLPRYKDFSDDGKTLHGAYGERLMAYSQLGEAISELKRDNDSRRAIVAIWQPERDAGYVGKDMPCNFAVDFKVREGALTTIVHNRSNDAIWGAYGSNVVQFSFLHQYVAMCLGINLGPYVQISDSMHIYPDNEPTKTLLREPNYRTDPYAEGWAKPEPWLTGFSDADDWDDDLTRFFDLYDENKTGAWEDYKTDWWQFTAYPMWRAFCCYKQDNMSAAASFASQVRSSDWKTAAVQWLARIERKRSEKQ